VSSSFSEEEDIVWFVVAERSREYAQSKVCQGVP
jgi:hypothetical protein